MYNVSEYLWLCLDMCIEEDEDEDIVISPKIHLCHDERVSVKTIKCTRSVNVQCQQMECLILFKKITLSVCPILLRPHQPPKIQN